MAALLSCGMESSDRIFEHSDDSRRQGIEIIPPDVNLSDVEFSVIVEKDAKHDASLATDLKSVAQRKIAFGLGAIKGLSETAAGAVVEERIANGPFKHVFDLCERVDPKVLTKGNLEILVKAGGGGGGGGGRARWIRSEPRAALRGH